MSDKHFEALVEQRIAETPDWVFIEDLIRTIVRMELEAEALQAENAKLREALKDIADGSGHHVLPTAHEERTRYWKSRHNLFVGIANEALDGANLEGGAE